MTPEEKMEGGRRSLSQTQKEWRKVEKDTKNLEENEREKGLFFSCLVDFQYKKEAENENKKTENQWNKKLILFFFFTKSWFLKENW